MSNVTNSICFCIISGESVELTPPEERGQLGAIQEEPYFPQFSFQDLASTLGSSVVSTSVGSAQAAMN